MGVGRGAHPDQLTDGDALTFVYDAKRAALSTACYLPDNLSAG
jgi:hypothetical protein